jgi:hypothetical protein
MLSRRGTATGGARRSSLPPLPVLEMLAADMRSPSPWLESGRSRERGGGAGLAFAVREGRSLDPALEVDENDGRMADGVDGADGA